MQNDFNEVRMAMLFNKHMAPLNSGTYGTAMKKMREIHERLDAGEVIDPHDGYMECFGQNTEAEYVALAEKLKEPSKWRANMSNQDAFDMEYQQNQNRFIANNARRSEVYSSPVLMAA